MALRAVIEHPKFANLTRVLGIERWGALGVLEAMWHFCGRFTPEGNIGKYSDAEIEAWIGWQGEPGSLVAAFVECRWIDRDPTHRLIVHDWHKHADDATKLSIKRANSAFVVPTLQVQTGDLSGQCRDSVATTSGLPEPVPEPVPGAEPVIPPTPQGDGEEVAELVGYLNERAGRNFTTATATVKALRARIGEVPKSKRVEFVARAKLVIDHKCAWWSGTDQAEYLRVETLFRASHWESYVQAAEAWDRAGRPPRNTIVPAARNGQSGRSHGEIARQTLTDLVKGAAA